MAPASPVLDATATAAPVDHRVPVVLVATANEAEGARHLRSLTLELQDIVAALDEAQREPICEVVTLPDATPEQVVGVFQDDRYRDRIAILHFAGHAGPEGLLFETGDGSTAVADAGGLAAFLGCQRGLQLVVLNACATQAHVDALRDAGVGAVVATSRTVEDEIAHQFAVLLYQGLGGGAGIKRAYDEAAAGVRFKHGATARGSTAESMHASAEAATVARDIGRKNAITTDDGRWPWDLYFRRGAEESVGPWALPEAAGNPLFGLPRLTETDAPLTEPFRHLRPFAREHAELFFGRGKDIRELYDKVMSSASEPVMLFYGATGVGKSSLLDAGLLPRLTGSHEIRYARRDRSLGLLGTLARALDADVGGAGEAKAMADAWRAIEARTARPLFVVVDQIEEAYTSEDAGHTGIGAGARELDAFAAAIAGLFAGTETRPRGRLVLGFRKEWLSEVKAALEAHRVPRTEHRLEQLTRGGVLEAINGPTRLPARRMPTRLELEPGLDVLIADDLLANRASHVAPLLQILLAEMWLDAARRDGVVRFDATLYDTVRAKAKQLDAFLTQQLAALREWHAPTVDSGLALDYLRFHTTPKGSSDERTLTEERAAYPSSDEPPPGIRAMCARLFLLVEADEPNASAGDRPARLGHDTLAPLIRERFERSDAPGPRARRILEGRAAEWSEGRTGVPLDAADLTVVEAGEGGMRVWTPDEQRLIAASRTARERAQRRRAWVIRGAITAVVVIAAFGVGSWLLYRQSQSRLAESTSRELGSRALATDALHRDVALLTAAAAYERAPTFEARRALFTEVARDPSLVRVVSTTGNDIVFADDGHLLVADLDGMQRVDLATGTESQAGPVPAGIDPAHLLLDRTGSTMSAAEDADTTDGVRAIRVWEVASGRELGRLTVPVESPGLGYQVSWAVGPVMADRRRLVAAMDGNDIVLWDLATAARVRTLRGFRTPPMSAVFSADGSVVAASAPGDGETIAWDVSSGVLLRRVRMGREVLPSVALSRDNSVMAIAGNDTLWLWPVRSDGAPRRTTGEFSHLAFTARDSALVVSARDGEVRVFVDPLENRMPLQAELPTVTLRGAGDLPDALSVSADGQRIAALSQGFVHVWDLADTTMVGSRALPVEPGTELRAMTLDARVALAPAGRELAVWDLTARRVRARATLPVDTTEGPPGSDPATFGGGRYLAGPAHGFDNRGPRDVFDASTGQFVRRIPAPADSPVAFEPQGTRAAYEDPVTHRIILTDVVTGAADTLDARPYVGADADTIYGAKAVFNARGTLLVAQIAQLSILVWDLERRAVRDSLTAIALVAKHLLVSDAGEWVAASQEDMVQFWRRGTRDPVSRHRWAAESETVALSADGSLFAYDNYGAVTLVDVARGDALGTIQTGHGSNVTLAFVDDGQAIVGLSESGHVTRIPTDPAAWLARACAIAASRESRERFAVDAPAGTTGPSCR